MTPLQTTIRKIARLSLLSLCWGGASALCGCSNLENVQLMAGGADYWRPKLSGFVEVDDSALAGSKLNFQDELNVNDEDIINFHGTISVPGLVLTIDYFELNTRGREMTTNSLSFNGISFPSNANLVSDVNFELLSGKMHFPILPLGPIQLGGIVGVNSVTLKTELIADAQPDGSPGSTASSSTFEEIFPVAGVSGRFDLPIGSDMEIFVAGEVSALGIEFLDFEGLWVDTEFKGGMKYSALSFGAGYRWLEVDVDDRDSDTQADFTLQGPFIFAEFVF